MQQLHTMHTLLLVVLTLAAATAFTSQDTSNDFLVPEAAEIEKEALYSKLAPKLLRAVVHGHTPPPVGLAYSGGGLTAFIATMCTQRALDTLLGPAANSSRIISGVSGGTLGYAMYANGLQTLEFPTASDSLAQLRNSTLAELSSKPRSRNRPYWMGAILDFIPTAMHAHELRGVFNDSWWVDVLKLAGKLSYNLDFGSMNPGNQPFWANFALIRQDATPTERNSSTGAIPDPENVLFPLAREMRSGEVYSAANLSVGVESIEAMAASSAFWAALVLEGSLKYAFLHGAVMRFSATESNGHEISTYGLDGGTTDSTGIVSLLIQQTLRIVAFYNDNDDLEMVNSPLAYLFGNRDGVPNSMNSLQGPVAGQVFHTQLYEDVYQNLTDGNLLRAELRNVSVLDNGFYGVRSYVLDTLLIISNQRSSTFLKEFKDESVSAALDDRWPNKFSVSMPTLDANVLCAFNSWKVMQNADRLQQILA